MNKRISRTGVVVCNKKIHEGTIIVLVTRDSKNKKYNIKEKRKKFFVSSCEKNVFIENGTTVKIEDLGRRISKLKTTKIVEIIKRR